MCTSSASWLLLVIGHPGTGHFSRCRDDLEGPGSFKSSRSNLAAGTRTTARAAGSRSTELFGSWTIFSTSAIRPRSSSCSSLPSLSSTSSSLTSCPALLRLLSGDLAIASCLLLSRSCTALSTLASNSSCICRCCSSSSSASAAALLAFRSSSSLLNLSYFTSSTSAWMRMIIRLSFGHHQKNRY